MSKYRDGIIDRLTKGKGLMGVDSIKLAALIDEIARLEERLAGLAEGGRGRPTSFIFGNRYHQVPQEPEKGEYESSSVFSECFSNRTPTPFSEKFPKIQISFRLQNFLEKMTKIVDVPSPGLFTSSMVNY